LPTIPEVVNHLMGFERRHTLQKKDDEHFVRSIPLWLLRTGASASGGAAPFPPLIALLEDVADLGLSNKTANVG
jgi:hypothetical protein